MLKSCLEVRLDMIRSLALRLIVVLSLSVIAGAAHGYSAIPFPAPVYWVASWNQPSYVPDDSGTTWDGISWDARLVYDPDIVDDRFYFVHKTVRRFFYAESLTSEPRYSAYWHAAIEDTYATLWAGVEEAARSKAYPVITNAIIRHMIATGIMTEANAKKMSSEAITQALQAFTALAGVGRTTR